MRLYSKLFVVEVDVHCPTQLIIPLLNTILDEHFSCCSESPITAGSSTAPQLHLLQLLLPNWICLAVHIVNKFLSAQLQVASIHLYQTLSRVQRRVWPQNYCMCMITSWKNQGAAAEADAIEDQQCTFTKPFLECSKGCGLEIAHTVQSMVGRLHVTNLVPSSPSTSHFRNENTHSYNLKNVTRCRDSRTTKMMKRYT